jgi:hypothetical protein
MHVSNNEPQQQASAAAGGEMQAAAVARTPISPAVPYVCFPQVSCK